MNKEKVKRREKKKEKKNLKKWNLSILSFQIQIYAGKRILFLECLYFDTLWRPPVDDAHAWGT